MSSESTDLEDARVADTQYLVRRSMTKGYQLFSIITPPVYIGFSLFRKRGSHITVNRLLRATWLGGVSGMCHRKIQNPGIPLMMSIQVLLAAELLSMSGPQAQVRRHFALAGFTLQSMYLSWPSSTHLSPFLTYCILQRASQRADDHATIGALLSAVLTPAIFWKRAAAVHRGCLSGFLWTIWN